MGIDMRRWVLCLLLVAPVLASAGVTYTWEHSGLAADGSALPVARLAFQIEYSVEGGPLSYIDVPAGAITVNGGTGTHAQALTLLCQQRIVARVRASYQGAVSSWSAQAQGTAPDCPAPAHPVNVTLELS